MEKTRIQLQKGDQAGWVSFGEASPPVEVVQRAVMPTQQVPGGQPRRNMNGNAPQTQAGLPPNPILPPPSVPIPGGGQAVAPKVNDVPLPPP